MRHCRGVFAGLMLATLLLHGCATPLAPGGSPGITGTAAQATTFPVQTRFTLAGRFSAKNGQDSVSGQFRYVQNAEQRSMALFSPLGTPVADIVANAQVATLTFASGAVRSAASFSDLLRGVIDVPLADAMLVAWLQGLPLASPDQHVTTERDGNGLPTRFVEAGWEILIAARMETNTVAPRRMRWTFMAQPETEVRWVVDEWSNP